MLIRIQFVAQSFYSYFVRSNFIRGSFQAESSRIYCLIFIAEAVKKPLYAAKMIKYTKVHKYFQAYKNMIDDIHFEQFVVESGGEAGNLSPPHIGGCPPGPRSDLGQWLDLGLT